MTLHGDERGQIDLQCSVPLLEEFINIVNDSDIRTPDGEYRLTFRVHEHAPGHGELESTMSRVSA